MQPLSSALRSQISAALDSFVDASRAGTGVGLSIVYRTKASWPHSSVLASASKSPVVDVAVLDSSFNPPHLAHLALASSKPHLSQEPSTSRSRHYPAHLFLLSSRNADKGMGKSGDATPLQRLSMMVVLAKDLEEKLRQDGVDEDSVNVAVAICEEPLMKDKSSIVHAWLRQQGSKSNGEVHAGEASSPPFTTRTRLHWVVGWDTLIRFFALKYYPSEEDFAKACQRFFVEEGTTFMCARRNMDVDAADERKQRQEEDDFLQSDLVRPWVERRGVTIFDLPADVRHVSSTRTRELIRRQDLSGEAKRAAAQEEGLLTPGLASFVTDESIY